MYKLIGNFFNIKRVTKWALQLAALGFKTPFVDFTIELPKDLVDSFIQKLQDDELTDEEFGQFLQDVSKEL